MVVSLSFSEPESTADSVVERRFARPSKRILEAGSGRLVLAPALRTCPEDFDGVTDFGEPMLGGYCGRPHLDLVVAHLDRGTAAAAHQVVVVMLRAPAVHRLAGVGAQRVDHSCCG